MNVNHSIEMAIIFTLIAAMYAAHNATPTEMIKCIAHERNR